MTALKVIVGALTLACVYITASQASKDVYYPPGGQGWSKWVEWCKCSKKCGSGDQYRTRYCRNPPGYKGANQCTGKPKETRHCNVHHCPINGGWSKWSPWRSCSRTCGNGGTQSRSRTCTNPRPRYGGKGCSGPKSQRRPCNRRRCPVRIGFVRPFYRVNEGVGSVTIVVKRSGDTSGITVGQVTVAAGGSASSADYGSFNGKVTFAPGAKSASVQIPIVDDKIVERAEFFILKLSSPDSFVSVRPDKTKVIIIDNDKVYIGFKRPTSRTVPESVRSFKVTIVKTGATTLSHSVSVRSVDGSAQSSAPADFVRINPATVSFGPSDTFKVVTVTIIDDKIDEKTESFRLVLSTSDVNRVTITRRIYIINIRDNDVNGNWGRWSPWTRCNKPCGRGSQSRSRKCNNPAPQGGGRPCQGPSSQTRICFIKRYCAIDGGFGSWSPWSKCSKPCGRGSMHRTRKCNNPAPRHHGRPCLGPYRQTRNCNVKCCPVKGGYGKWSKWSRCSISCKATRYSYGYRKRYRKCNSPAPYCGGARCYGLSYQRRKCVPYLKCRRRHGASRRYKYGGRGWARPGRRRKYNHGGRGRGRHGRRRKYNHGGRGRGRHGRRRKYKYGGRGRG